MQIRDASTHIVALSCATLLYRTDGPHQIMEAGLPIRHSVAHVGSQNDLALLGHHLEPFPDNVHVLRARRETAVIEICLRSLEKLKLMNTHRTSARPIRMMALYCSAFPFSHFPDFCPSALNCNSAAPSLWASMTNLIRKRSIPLDTKLIDSQYAHPGL